MFALRRHLNLGEPINRSSPLMRGIVSRWKVLNCRNTGSGLLDLASKNHGTLTNGPLWSSALGRPGGSGSLDFSPGVTTRVSHLRLSSLAGCSAFSLSCWVRVKAGLSLNNGFWGKWDDGGGTTQHFSRYNSGMQWFVNNSANSATANITIADASITKAVWSHFVFVADGSNLRAYLDGLSAATAVAFNGPYIPSDTVNWQIGFGRTDSSLSQQDDMMYWNRALSASEISILYQATSQQFDPTLNWIEARAMAPAVAAPPASDTAGQLTLLGCGA